MTQQKNKKSELKNSALSIDKFVFKSSEHSFKSNNNYAGNFRKSLASATDSLILLLTRGVFLQIYGSFFLVHSIERFGKDFLKEFGTNTPKINFAHTQYFLHHPLFTEIFLLFLTLILIGAFYHGYFLSSKWHATIGKRVFEVFVKKTNQERPSFWRGFFYYISSILPYAYLIFIGLYCAINSTNPYEALTATKANLVVGLFFGIWMQFSFINKSKLTISELLLGIRLIEGKTDAKFPSW